jgi:hypothetical protein
MREAGTGLFPGKRKSTGKSSWIRKIRADRVFRRTQDQCAHNPKKISALRTELVFRDIPGKLRQRRR